MVQWVGAQGQVKVAKKNPLVAFPPENPSPKAKKNSFRFRLQDLLNP